MGGRALSILSILVAVSILLTTHTPYLHAQDLVVFLKDPKIDPVISKDLLARGRAEAIIVLRDDSATSKKAIEELLGGGVIRIYDNIPYIYGEIDLSRIPVIVSMNEVVAIAPNTVFKKQVLDRIAVLDYRKMQQSISYPALVNWGLFRTGAISVWREFNITGGGLIIAILDTGVNINHPIIRDKIFSINYSDPKYPGGWIEFDSKGRPVCSIPHDTDGHGSWVTSIAVGGDTRDTLIGYAPGARYMHALVLPTGSGTFAQVLAGIDWVADPYTCDGIKISRLIGRTFRPNIVSMSFGSEGNYSNYLLPAIRTLLSHDIVPIAAIGNGGIYTSSNPGNIWGVFGVGSVERNDEVSLFSSGEYVEWPDPPSSWPFKNTYPREYYKPDFVIPGVMIPGAYISEELIAIGSGTSAGPPALAGIVALAIQASRVRNISVSPDIIYDLISSTAYKAPNMSRIRYGNGVVNAFMLISSIMGYRLRILDGSSNYASYQVGSGGLYTIRGYQNVFTLYLDDQVFRGSGGVASFIVPPSDYGDHYIHAYSLDGGIYSYTRIKVEPSIRVSGSYYSGQEVLLRLDGFPAVEAILIRYTSTSSPGFESNIIAIGFPNLRGRIDVSARLPYVDTIQRISIIASDIIGLIGSSISITIYPPQVQQIIVPHLQRPLQVLFSGPQTATPGDGVSLTLYLYSGGERVRGNVSIYIYYSGSTDSPPAIISSIERRSVDSLSIVLNTTRTGIYIVWVRAAAVQNFAENRSSIQLEGYATYMVRVIPREEALALENLFRNMTIISREIAIINSSILSILSTISSLRDMYIDLANRYSNLYRNIESLSRELNETKRGLSSASERISSAIEEATRARNTAYIAILAVILLTLLVALAYVPGILRIKRG